MNKVETGVASPTLRQGSSSRARTSGPSTPTECWREGCWRLNRNVKEEHLVLEDSEKCREIARK